MTKPFNDFLEGLSGLVERLRGTSRAISTPHIEGQVLEHVYETFGGGWLMNVFLEDDNAPFAVFVSAGKLYRIDFEIDRGAVTNFSDPVDVMIDFVEREKTESDFVIRKQPDGRYRWISFSATAVLNRVGEIDSTDLFDSFVEKFDPDKGPPVTRQLYHLGETARTGEVDFVLRRGNVLVASGLYDETPLAKAEIKARQADPDFWGDSIGYDPLDEPEMLAVGDVEIPVYKSGVLREISTVAEHDAASWFTTMPVIQSEQEVERMKRLSDAQVELLRDRIFGDYDDPDAAIQSLLERADGVDREITASGAIARSADDPADDPVDDPVDDPDEADQPEDPGDLEVILDDDAVDAIVSRVAEDQAGAIREMSEKLDSLLADVGAEVERLTAEVADLSERLTAAEEDADKRRTVDDLDSPIVAALRVGYRPSQKDGAGNGAGESDLPPSDRGNAALEKFPTFRD